MLYFAKHHLGEYNLEIAADTKHLPFIWFDYENTFLVDKNVCEFKSL